MNYIYYFNNIGYMSEIELVKLNDRLNKIKEKVLF